MLWLKTHLKSAHSRSHPVVRQDTFEVSIRHNSGAWLARNGRRDDSLSRWLEKSQEECFRRRKTVWHRFRLCGTMQWIMLAIAMRVWSYEYNDENDESPG